MCLALSSVVGVWYLLRKVREPRLCWGGAGTGQGVRLWLCTCPGDPPLLFFVSSSALDRQQSLRAGVFPQRGGAAALEQRQHRLHLAWGPLHLRRLLGKREHSPGRTRVAAGGGRHVRGLVPLRRQRAGCTHARSQDFHFLSPEGCGGDDRIKRRPNVAQQMAVLCSSWLRVLRAAGISSGSLVAVGLLPVC